MIRFRHQSRALGHNSKRKKGWGLREPCGTDNTCELRAMERRCPQGQLGRVCWCWAGLGVWAKPRQGRALTAAYIFLVFSLCPCLFIGNSKPWGTGGWGWPEGKLVSWVAHAGVPGSHRGSGYIRIAWLLTSWEWLCGNVLDSEKRRDDVNVRGNIERSID